MKLNYILLLSLPWIFWAGSCDRDCQVSSGRYEFVLPVELTPALDTFHIGDTIKVVSQFSNNVYERVNGKEYLLDSFRFYPVTSIIKIDTAKGTDSFDDFEIIIPVEFDYERFNASTGSQALIGQYLYTKDTGYSLNYKIISLTKGVYLLRQASSISSFEPLQDFPGRCNLGGSSGVCTVNNNIDNNIHLLEDSPDPHFSEWVLEKPERRFYDLGSYVFVVTD